MPWPALALASGALAAHWVPGVADVFIYDRAAIAAGELWRLVTAHSVHFSHGHLLCNLVVLIVTGWLIEAQDRGDSVRLFAVAALLIGVVLFVAQPELRLFGGASGVVYAFVTYLGLRGLRDAGRRRWLCVALLAVVGAKLLAEQVWGWSLVARDADAAFVTVPLSHAAGTAAGAGLWLWKVLCGRKHPSPQPSPGPHPTLSRKGRGTYLSVGERGLHRGRSVSSARFRAFSGTGSRRARWTGP